MSSKLPITSNPALFWKETRASCLSVGSYQFRENAPTAFVGKKALYWKCSGRRPLLALDIGSHKTGVAITDNHQTMHGTRGLAVLTRKGFGLDAESVELWKYIWTKYEPSGLIVGNPLSLKSGSNTAKTVNIMEFLLELSRIIPGISDAKKTQKTDPADGSEQPQPPDSISPDSIIALFDGNVELSEPVEKVKAQKTLSATGPASPSSPAHPMRAILLWDERFTTQNAIDAIMMKSTRKEDNNEKQQHNNNRASIVSQLIANQQRMLRKKLHTTNEKSDGSVDQQAACEILQEYISFSHKLLAAEIENILIQKTVTYYQA